MKHLLLIAVVLTLIFMAMTLRAVPTPKTIERTPTNQTMIVAGVFIDNQENIDHFNATQTVCIRPISMVDLITGWAESGVLCSVLGHVFQNGKCKLCKMEEI